MTALSARWHRSLRELPEAQWQALVGEQVIPFYRWDWLVALEESGSIVPDQGWQPLHLSLWRGQLLVAVAPLYLKGHSYGEFVFDQVFARLAADLGERYYPKLVGMSPVSPVQGYRFHIAQEENAAELTALMLQVIDAFADRNGILSCNFLYVDPQWQPLAEAAGCATWVNQQSLWTADGQQSFADYLAGFNANQRRNIKRERRAVQQAGITVTALTGETLDAQVLQRMHSFYEQHCARWGMWGSKYLEAAFFDQLASPALREQVVLFSAHRGDPRDPVAMSLCVHDRHQLWGRYWGSEEEIDCLISRSVTTPRLSGRCRTVCTALIRCRRKPQASSRVCGSAPCQPPPLVSLRNGWADPSVVTAGQWADGGGNRSDQRGAAVQSRAASPGICRVN